MNKKIFTLLASSLMLFMTVVWVNAQNPGYGNRVQFLPDGMGTGAYHLKVTRAGAGSTGHVPTESLLAIDPDHGRLVLQDETYIFTSSSTTANDAYQRLRQTLWCVHVEKPEFYGQDPVFNFINKEFSTLLAVDSGRWIGTGYGTSANTVDFEDYWGNSLIWAQANGENFLNWLANNIAGGSTAGPEVYLGGQFANWRFSPSYSPTLTHGLPLKIEVADDYFMTFGIRNVGDPIQLVLVHVDDLEPGAFFYENYLVFFELVSAAPRVLTARDFNTKVYTQANEGYVQLQFSINTKGEPNVLDKPLLAYDALNNAGNPGDVDWYLNLRTTSGFVYVADGKDPDKDTGNYYGDWGLNQVFPKLFDNATSRLAPQPASALPDQQKSRDFRIVYYPTEDSLAINVRGLDHIEPTYGNSSPLDGTATDLDYNTGGGYGLGDEGLFNPEIWRFLYVGMQDLHIREDKRVLTIGNDESPVTRISFGVAACVIQENRTTVPNNLYVVRDHRGYYLGMPLEVGDYTPRWINLNENENPLKTPSFQWLIEPNHSSPYAPVTFTNREFDWVQLQYVQIYNTPTAFKGVAGSTWYEYLSFHDPATYVVFDNMPGGTRKIEVYYSETSVNGWNGSFMVVEDAPDVKALRVANIPFEQWTQDQQQRAYRTSPYLGYKYISPDTMHHFAYSFNYLNGYNPTDFYLGSTKFKPDTVLYAENVRNHFQLSLHDTLRRYGTEKYGIGWTDSLLTHPATKDIARLERYYYYFQENDYWNFTFQDHFLVLEESLPGRYVFTDEANANARRLNKAKFYLRFTYQPQGKPEYYTMLDRIDRSNFDYMQNVFGFDQMQPIRAWDWTHGAAMFNQSSYGVLVLGIEYGPLYTVGQPKTGSGSPLSTFAVSNEAEGLYRRFNVPVFDGSVEPGEPQDKPRLVKIYNSYNQQKVNYLYEDQNSIYSYGKTSLFSPPFNANLNNSIHFLGYENIYDHQAEVNRGINHFVGEGTHADIEVNDHNYAIYLDTAYVNRGTGWIKPQYMLVMGPIFGDKDGCYVCGDELKLKPWVYGRYLVNASDSAYINANNTAQNSPKRDEAYLWDVSPRLAFVPAVHAEDTLYILNGVDYKQYYYKDDFDEEYLDIRRLSLNPNVDKHRLDDNFHKDVVFSMRFFDRNDKENFLLESETTNRSRTQGRMIAPMEGGWVKVENNVPVISSRSIEGYNTFQRAILEADRWNTEITTDKPVANSQIAASSVSVIAGEGTLTILNAAGKRVAVSNVLGQTVVNTVLTSDNATISAPKGILVVAVEGDNAVKAVVQ